MISTKIIKQEKNPFLSREEIILEMNSETAPKIEDVKNAIGKDENLTIVKRINSNFGKHVFTADVLVYDNIEAKDKIEVIPQKVRKKLAAEKKAEEESKAKAEEESKSKVEEESKAKVEEETKNEEAKTEETSTEKTKEENKETKTEEKTE
jgi:ribosomal protein S24E